MIVIIVAGVVLGLFQNCHRIRKTPITFDADQKNHGASTTENGEGYGGKPSPGDYVRRYPKFVCPDPKTGTLEASLQGQIHVSDIGLNLTIDNCTNMNHSIPLGDPSLVYGPHNPDYFGLNGGIFSSSSTGFSEDMNVTETWCRSVSEVEGLDIVVHVDEGLQKAQGALYLGSYSSTDSNTDKIWKNKKVAPFDVSREAATGLLAYSNGPFRLEIERGPADLPTFPGHASVLIDNVSYQKDVVCRVMNRDSATGISKLDSSWLDLTGLSLYWKLNENPAVGGTQAIDSSGNGNHGSLFLNAAATNRSVFGKLDLAFDFIGAGNIVRAASPVNVAANNQPQTISAWFKFDDFNQVGASSVVNLQNRNPGSSISLGFNGTAAQELVVSKWGGTALVRSGYMTIAANTWHHYVYTFDGSIHRIYFNGVEVGTGTQIPDSAVPDQIDLAFRDGNSDYLKGVIDEVSLWRRTLSANEIKTIYQRQRY